MAQWKLDPFWFALGMVGQATFFSRFLVQWVASERVGKSYIPRVFWWLSLAGSMLLLAYAIHRKDPVFVLGQAFGWVIYARNLALIRRGGVAAG
jgi:lipid-A-disaccharide synthase-like uncharacterized protein